MRAPFQTRAFGQGIARQPDGKLLAAGVVHPAQGYEQVALVRFQPDGTLDASFGTGGVALAIALAARGGTAAFVVGMLAGLVALALAAALVRARPLPRPLAWAALVWLSVLGILLFAVVVVTERIVMPWSDSGGH